MLLKINLSGAYAMKWSVSDLCDVAETLLKTEHERTSDAGLALAHSLLLNAAEITNSDGADDKDVQRIADLLSEFSAQTEALMARATAS